jgi:hypothetical protein
LLHKLGVIGALLSGGKKKTCLQHSKNIEITIFIEAKQK